jgi:uncharacterized protein YegJ (DUF2314 family)
MNRTSRLTLVIFALAFVPFAACYKQDQVIIVEHDDAEMLAAIAKARGSLPDFWKVFDKPEHGENSFSLKVKITDKGGVEYFWVTDLQKQDGKISGTINNDPEIVTTVKLGQRIDVPEADISDWLYVLNDKMVGNETLRPLLKKMPADEAAQLKSMMANP